MDKESTERLCYGTLTGQLERMRAMQYGYHRLFFQWIVFTLVLFLLLFIVPHHRGALFLPFLVVTAGLQASFYLHFCDFARTHSRHLEEKINGLLGKRVLLGAELEDLYFYRQETGKIGGLLPAHPLRFFNIYTLHWLLLWTFGFLYGSYHAYLMMRASWFLLYASTAFVWLALHLIYLAWYFGRGRDLKALSTHLQVELGRPCPPEKS